MRNKWPIWLFVVLLFGAFETHAQTSDFGIIGGVDLEKAITRRWDVSLGNEVRIYNNATQLQRYSFDLGTEYAIINKWLKIGAHYAYLYQYDSGDHYYDSRHRAYVTATLKRSLGDFDFSLRTRFQSTWRDETRGSYKVNPKLYWRNKASISYSPRKSKWEPSISCELFTPLNDPYFVYGIDKMRYTAELDYKVTKQHSVSVSFRLDQDIYTPNPAMLYSIGCSYKYKF